MHTVIHDIEPGSTNLARHPGNGSRRDGVVVRARSTGSVWAWLLQVLLLPGAGCRCWLGLLAAGAGWCWLRRFGLTWAAAPGGTSNRRTSRLLIRVFLRIRVVGGCRSQQTLSGSGPRPLHVQHHLAALSPALTTVELLEGMEVKLDTRHCSCCTASPRTPQQRPQTTPPRVQLATGWLAGWPHVSVCLCGWLVEVGRLAGRFV